MTGVTIANDAGGCRLELGHSSASALALLGPYELTVKDNDYTFTPSEAGLKEQNITGCRSGDLRGLRVHSNDPHGSKLGRFGPCPVDVDLEDPNGFTAPLPPLHQRPWPTLRENEGAYNIDDQLMQTLAERINDRLDCRGISVKDAIQAEQRRIPDNLRRFMPRGKDTMSILLNLMEKLRSTTGSA